jgi:hypothetical protein
MRSHGEVDFSRGARSTRPKGSRTGSLTRNGVPGQVWETGLPPTGNRGFRATFREEDLPGPIAKDSS